MSIMQLVIWSLLQTVLSVAIFWILFILVKPNRREMDGIKDQLLPPLKSGSLQTGIVVDSIHDWLVDDSLPVIGTHFWVRNRMLFDKDLVVP